MPPPASGPAPGRRGGARRSSSSWRTDASLLRRPGEATRRTRRRSSGRRASSTGARRSGSNGPPASGRCSSRSTSRAPRRVSSACAARAASRGRSSRPGRTAPGARARARPRPASPAARRTRSSRSRASGRSCSSRTHPPRRADRSRSASRPRRPRSRPRSSSRTPTSFAASCSCRSRWPSPSPSARPGAPTSSPGTSGRAGGWCRSGRCSCSSRPRSRSRCSGTPSGACRVLRGEEARRTPTFANRPLEIEVAAWPSVTIQIPVFRECFDDAIRPTLDAAREAARRYREQTGARCNAPRLRGRAALLRGQRPRGRARGGAPHGARGAEREPGRSSWRARPTTRPSTCRSSRAPGRSPGVPGTERPGRFRKASNLNYALRLADRLEGGEPLSEAHARFREAVPEHVYELGRSRGDVRVGEHHRPARQGQRDPARRDPGDGARVPGRPDARLHAARLLPDQRGALLLGGDRLVHPAALRPLDPRQVPDPGNAHARSWATTCSCAARTSSAWAAGTSTRSARTSSSCCASTSPVSHGKYIAYPGHEFGEAVTRVYTEELEKFRRYAFGAAEAVLNPISEWERRGIVKESWRRFCRSEHVRWYQVVDLLQFFFSLVNLASLVPLGILTGLGLVHPYRAASMLLMSVLVFGLVPIPAIYLLRRRGGLGGMPAGRIWGTRFGAWKAIAAQFALSYTFVGYSLAVSRGVLGPPLQPAPRLLRDERRRSRPALAARPPARARDAARPPATGSLLLTVGAALAVWRIHLDPSYGVGTGAVRLALPLRVALSARRHRAHARWPSTPTSSAGETFRGAHRAAARSPAARSAPRRRPASRRHRAARESPDVADGPPTRAGRDRRPRSSRRRSARGGAACSSPSARSAAAACALLALPWGESVDASGRVAPRRWARVRSEAPGVVREVRRRSGDLVQEGEVIAVLDSDEQRDALEGTRLALTRERQKLADLELRLRENADPPRGRRRGGPRGGAPGPRGDAHRGLAPRGARAGGRVGARGRPRLHDRGARTARDGPPGARGDAVARRGDPAARSRPPWHGYVDRAEAVAEHVGEVAGEEAGRELRDGLESVRFSFALADRSMQEILLKRELVTQDLLAPVALRELVNQLERESMDLAQSFRALASGARGLAGSPAERREQVRGAEESRQLLANEGRAPRGGAPDRRERHRAGRARRARGRAAPGQDRDPRADRRDALGAPGSPSSTASERTPRSASSRTRVGSS